MIKAKNVSDSIAEYVTLDSRFMTEFLGSLSNQVKAREEERYDQKRMWLVTEKGGSTMVIVSDEEPKRVGGTWMVLEPSKKGYLNSPFLSDIFGIFWKKASEELEKLGLPKWEDEPLEIELSKIKFNYY